MVRLGGRELILGEWFLYISDLRSLNEYILIFLKNFWEAKPLRPQHGSATDPVCYCQQGEESTSHALWFCPMENDAWSVWSIASQKLSGRD